MSHTNKTTHYNLPQFIGSDKASWLGDLNPAFSTIDNEMYAINTTATNADSKADSAQASADNGIALAQQAINNSTNLENKIKTEKLNATFTTTLNEIVNTTELVYNKYLGIIYIKGNVGFTPKNIKSGTVIGSVGNLLDNSYSTTIYAECILYLEDGTQQFKSMRISNNIITLTTDINVNVSGLAYNTTIMLDPTTFN